MGAVENIITDNLPIWSSAVQSKSSSGRGTDSKRTLYGVKKLRELILDLAVRGLLVPQDPNDEPASVLLGYITAIKERLVGEGKIKKQKPLLPLSLDELQFELPRGWKWVRLQDVSTYIQRGKGPKYSEEGRVKVISQKCVQSAGFDLAPARLIADDSLSAYQPERFLLEADLIWNSTGTGTVGRIAVAPQLPLNSVVGDSHVTIIRTIKTNPDFIKSYLSSSLIQERIDPEHENALVSGSTKQVELNTSTVIAVPVPLPPLAEQHRIVAKVDELMALCDTLEQQQEDSIQAHETLVEVLLEALTDAVDADASQAAWQRISENFDVLFTTEHSVNKLKETILQLAVMGKLVPQDPNDEPASVLLEKIAAEKEEQIKGGKIKKSKPLPSIEKAEERVIPASWEFIRFGAGINVLNGRAYKKNEMLSEGTPLLRVGNLFTSNDWYYSDLQLEPQKYIDNGDLIYAWSASFGPFIWEGGKVIYHYHIWKLDFYDDMSLSKNYVYLYLLNETAAIKASGNGITMVHMTKERMEKLLLPVPPLAEQHRIVAKVDELMALCDKLKEFLQQVQQTQIHLTDAVVENAL